MDMDPIDIRFGTNPTFDVLSNLADKPFVFEGDRFRSIESLLQSLKVADINEQRDFWRRSGLYAKKHGRKIDWWTYRTLWWKGVPLDRDGDEYQLFLDRVYGKCYAQNAVFRAVLASTGDRELQHSIGTVDQERTILTRSEFLDRLVILRDLATKKLS